MKLKDIRETYYTHTQKASDLSRYLALAGIGLVWIFRIQAADKLSLPKDLILPTLLLTVGLSLDLLQYIAGSIIWGAYNRHKEKSGAKESDEFKCPRALNWPTLFFFWSKLISIALAYYLILAFLRRTLLS